MHKPMSFHHAPTVPHIPAGTWHPPHPILLPPSSSPAMQLHPEDADFLKGSRNASARGIAPTDPCRKNILQPPRLVCRTSRCCHPDPNTPAPRYLPLNSPRFCSLSIGIHLSHKACNADPGTSQFQTHPDIRP